MTEKKIVSIFMHQQVLGNVILQFISYKIGTGTGVLGVWASRSFNPILSDLFRASVIQPNEVIVHIISSIATGMTEELLCQISDDKVKTALYQIHY